MIYNAVVFVYMLLASFPCIGEEERAAAQLVVEHILTFNFELGRIILTRESYEHAQELLPQLLVLASRHGLVYPAGRTPSFMNIAVLLQTIIEPLVLDLNILARMEVYATEGEARQLFKLPLAQLQATVDAWVCEDSELLPSRPTSASAPLEIYSHNLAACEHGGVWWRAFDQTKVSQTTPSISSSNLAENPTNDLIPDSHGDVWWSSLCKTKARSPAAESQTCFSKPASAARGHGDVWWTSLPQTKARLSAARSAQSLLTEANLQQFDEFRQTYLAGRTSTNFDGLPSGDNSCDLHIPDELGFVDSYCYCQHSPTSELWPPWGIDPEEYASNPIDSMPRAIPASAMLSPSWGIGRHVYTSSQEFSDSTPSFGPLTPTGPWPRSFSGSTPSFSPSTPMDSAWGYNSSLTDCQRALPWDAMSISDDVHERPHIEVRKAKKATMGRRFVRKLKLALAAVRNACD